MYSNPFVVARKKIAENNTFKSKLVNIHITEPFRNKKTDKNHWVVVYGDSGKSFVLKPRFIWKYLSCLLLDLLKVKKTKINIDHCYTYYEIGIQKYEFGIESKWKSRNSNDSCKQGAPVKRLSYVYSSENNNREGLVESIKFFFMSMKKRDDNPIGNLIIKDLKETAEGLYRHMMKGDTKNEDLVAEMITHDINQHFSDAYNIIWNDTLNHFLVDFDIICILKNHIGYNSWSDVPMDQRELCQRGYNQNNTLPDWNAEQEEYRGSVQSRKTLIMCWYWNCSIKTDMNHVLVLLLVNQIIPTINYLIQFDCKCDQQSDRVRIRIRVAVRIRVCE